MNRIQKVALGLIVLVSFISALAQTDTAPANGKKHRTPQVSVTPAQMSRGQQVFQQNCSRCHNAPQGVPPQILATIIRHMRVRASLSAADESALLGFMNP